MSFYRHGKFVPLHLLYSLSAPLPEPSAQDDPRLETLRAMYLDEDMTARDICKHYGVEYTPYIQKLFFKAFGPKGKGWGGARKNAGNNKHLILNPK